MERTLFQQQEAQAVSEGATARHPVAVYKTPGGDRDEPSPPVAKTPLHIQH